MTAGNDTAREIGTPPVASKRFPPETQARALLRLVASTGRVVAEVTAYGEIDLGHDPEDAERARALTVVQALADRRPIGDACEYRVQARSALRDLRRLASIDREAFARACADVDAREREVMAMAILRTQPEHGPLSAVQGRGRASWPLQPGRDVDPQDLGNPTEGAKPDPGLAAVRAEMAETAAAIRWLASTRLIPHPNMFGSRTTMSGEMIDSQGPRPDTRADAHREVTHERQRPPDHPHP